MSQGVFTKPAVNKKDETYALAEDAAYRVTQFNEKHYVNSKFYDTVIHLGKYGGCFWEITEDIEFLSNQSINQSTNQPTNQPTFQRLRRAREKLINPSLP